MRNTHEKNRDGADISTKKGLRMETLYQKNEHPTLIKSTSRHSTSSSMRLDELSSIRSNAKLPDTEMQLGMMLRMKGGETTRNVGDVNPQVVIDQSRLMILEDSLTVMQKRNGALIAENESLNDQVKRTLAKIRELEVKNLSVERKLEGSDGLRLSKTVEDRGVSTMEFLATKECGSQAWAVCRACERKFEDRKTDEATAIITKSELDKLEKDMQRLREAVAIRESDWKRAVEREHCYREQLKRLATESMTGRQIADSRHAEIERLAQTLAENEKDLRSAQKEITGLKKIIVKQEKRQRELEAKCPSIVDNATTSTEINEKELRWIDDIVRQLSNAKNKQKSKPIKEKAIYTSGINSSSNQSTPRAHQTNTKNILEPSTVVEMLSKL